MKCRLALIFIAVAALVGVVALAWSRQPRMVRVGGRRNACTCTQRIEP